jgi:hypothetical protein
MSFFDVIKNIEAKAKKLTSKERYSKNQFLGEYSTMQEIIDLKKQFNDGSLVDRVIASMPEKSFCEVVEVRDCEVASNNKCSCTKVIVFEEDSVNGKLCERFTVTVRQDRCEDGNFELAKCIASSSAASCDSVLFDKDQTIVELRERLANLQNEMLQICDAIGGCTKDELSSVGL